MSSEEKAEYKHEKYEALKAKGQEVWKKEFAWLAFDNLARGWHCALCITSSIKPQDKLSTTGYGFLVEGEARVCVPIPMKSKLTTHDIKDQHTYNQRVADEKKLGKSAAGTPGKSAQVLVTITTEDELYFRTIRTMHLIVKRELSLNDMWHLLELQSANGMVISYCHANSSGDINAGGLSSWLLAGANIFRAQQRDRASSSLMRSLFPSGIPFGFMGDGSNDRSMIEQEAVVLRFLDSDGKPYNTFFDLAPLDLAESADGRSPDAKCITAAYAKSLSTLNQHEGFLHLSDWKKAAVGGSFDGASVMMGAQGGVAKLLKDQVETNLNIVHAVAHVQQLGNLDGFHNCDYYDEWRETVQAVYVHYAGSGKKRFGLEAVAEQLDAQLLKLQTTHGIRWAASQAKTIKALLTDLPAVVVDLEKTVKDELGLEFNQLTPSLSFVNKTFMQAFSHDGGRVKKWKAIVKRVEPSADGLASNDKFGIYYPGDKQWITMSKAELVAHLTDETNPKLAEHPLWLLRSKLTAWRFPAFSAFMLDVHEQLAILSKSYQSNSVLVFDIARNLNKCLAKLEKARDHPSDEEKKFLNQVDEDDANALGTCKLFDVEDGRAHFKTDRAEVIDGLSDHLTTRFTKVLDNPVLQAMSLFDKRKWPSDKATLQESWHSELETLFDAYRIFFLDTTTADDVIEEWKQMAPEILESPGLMSRSFHDLWSHMLVSFSDEYPLVLRLAAIMLLVPVDTSECERVFSLMNDLKTSQRERMGQENLKNQMLWHTVAKGLKCEEVPVVAILNEWRKMAGFKGRNKHVGTNPPKYEYRVKMETDE